MAALPHVRRQAASCRCAISAPSAILSAASATAAAGRRQASARARSTAPSPPGLHGEQSAINHEDIMHANDYQKLRLEEAEASQAS
uniref:Uncharacterized protein n=1 Tax=Oryza rufipogon TaxID=4529 RepID=A0A0E0QFZ8_ORYRU